MGAQYMLQRWCLLSMSSHSEGDMGCLWSLFSKALIPVVWVPTSWSESTFQRLHLLIYRLGFHPMNLRGPETFRPWWYFFMIRDSVTDSFSYFIPSAWTILFIPLTWHVMIPMSLLPVSGCFLKAKDKNFFWKTVFPATFWTFSTYRSHKYLKSNIYKNWPYAHRMFLNTSFFLFYWWP